MGLSTAMTRCQGVFRRYLALAPECKKSKLRTLQGAGAFDLSGCQGKAHDTQTGQQHM